jgi:transposase-like protein
MPKGKSPRKFTGNFKFQIVSESLKNESNQAEIARAYQIDPKLISLWKNQFIKNGYKIFELKTDENAQKISELEKIIGKQTVEISLLKKFLGHFNSE